MTGERDPRLVIGARVRVRHDPDFPPGPWPAEPLATVVPWPGMLVEIAPSIEGGELFRLVEHRAGPERHYFVEFDEPQFDADGPDGGGPYESADVWEAYLEPLD
jgi:hypothetical protein